MIRILILFSFLSLEIFSQATITKIVNEKGAIKNLTEEQFVSNVVDLIHNEKHIIASVNAGLQVEYKLTGETVSNFKEFGNMALVFTNKNLHAISNNARQPLFSDMNISYTVSNSLIFVITNRKIYSYTISSSEWKSIDLTGEYVRSHAAFDKTGTLITNKRIISYSEFTKEFHFFNIDIFTPVNNYTVIADKIVFASSKNNYLPSSDRRIFSCKFQLI